MCRGGAVFSFCLRENQMEEERPGGAEPSTREGYGRLAQWGPPPRVIRHTHRSEAAAAAEITRRRGEKEFSRLFAFHRLASINNPRPPSTQHMHASSVLPTNLLLFLILASPLQSHQATRHVDRSLQRALQDDVRAVLQILGARDPQRLEGRQRGQNGPACILCMLCSSE